MNFDTLQLNMFGLTPPDWRCFEGGGRYQARYTFGIPGWMASRAVCSVHCRNVNIDNKIGVRLPQETNVSFMTFRGVRCYSGPGSNSRPVRPFYEYASQAGVADPTAPQSE